jgi:flagellar protein FliL
MADKKEAAAAAEAAEMQEGAEAQPPKKKRKRGKLPVLIMLVAVLAGGGFFGMKVRGGSAPPKPELGEVVPLAEILVNLKDQNTYLRTEISLHLNKSFDKTQLEAKMDAVRHRIILILTSKSIREVRSVDGKLALTREIASRINELFPGPTAKPADSKARKNEDMKEPAAEKAAPKLQNPDWDSDTGPVLKVYFTNFATQ